LLAVVPASALVVVELGTSRTADRRADSADVIHDHGTSRLFDVATVVALGGGLLASRYLPWLTMRRARVAVVVGAGVMTGALALSWSARSALGRFHRNTLTIQVDHVLVESGPYRYVRHPLYSATVLAFMGIGTVLGNWASLAAGALPATALVRRIGVEEKMMLEHFGDSYRAYQRKTDRLIPGIW
jgi:protein-S-isoprenylcysteine O-methyltransferase Ste14